jgi:hypothetical protein
MACGMKDGKDDNRIRSQDVEDAVFESSGENPADIRIGAEAGVEERTFRRPFYCRSYLGEKIFSQPNLKPLIPKGTLKKILFRLLADDDPVGHCPSFAKSRASTSSQELPASGSFR